VTTRVFFYQQKIEKLTKNQKGELVAELFPTDADEDGDDD